MNLTALAANKDVVHGDSLTVECIDSVIGLASIGNELDVLSSVPFLQSSWMIPWVEEHGRNSTQLYLLVVRDSQNCVVGYAPLVLRDSFKRARHLAFIGSGKACADYMTFPALHDRKSQVIDAIFNYLTINCEQWDRIELDGVAKSDTEIQSFANKMEAFGCETTAIEGLPSYRLRLPENWEILAQSLSKNSRKKYRKLERRLQGKCNVHVATNDASLEHGLRILEDLHTARWQSLGSSGCFAHSNFRDLLTSVARQKLEAGTLSLIWMTFDGVPIAADIGFDGDGGFFTYQGGISPDHLHLEPGKAIIKSQMELAMQRGAKFIDFLRGDEPYKSRFPTDRIENVRYEITGTSTRGRLSQSMLKIGRLIKLLVNEETQSD